MAYGLTDSDITKLTKLFSENRKIEKVILYGSRAKGSFKLFSDVDITLTGNDLTRNDLNKLSISIDELLLPYKFDISIFSSLKNNDLIEHIKRAGKVIYEKR